MTEKKSSRHGRRYTALALAFCIVAGLQAAPLPELGTLSGKVTAPQAFQGAEVYIRNLDKHVLYMVYTSEGHYQAVDLLPGKYEVSVKKKGFSADVRKLEVKPGSALTADFALQEGTYGPAQLAVFNGPGVPRPEPTPPLMMNSILPELGRP